MGLGSLGCRPKVMALQLFHETTVQQISAGLVNTNITQIQIQHKYNLRKSEIQNRKLKTVLQPISAGSSSQIQIQHKYKYNTNTVYKKKWNTKEETQNGSPTN